jgi:hypothetical protein
MSGGLQLVTRRLTETMTPTGIEVGYGLENTSAGQSCARMVHHHCSEQNPFKLRAAIADGVSRGHQIRLPARPFTPVPPRRRKSLEPYLIRLG